MAKKEESQKNNKSSTGAAKGAENSKKTSKNNPTQTKKTETKSGKSSKTSSGKGNYSAEAITVLEGLEPVRRRPGMYIGTTSSEGLHHLIWEVFDNSRDEAMMGYADHVEIVLLPTGGVKVTDNGRGIPVDKHKQTGVSALETIMTTLHAGGKFGGGGYKIAGGLHGVGVSVVNALSKYARAEVHKDGATYVQEYEKGKRKAPVKKIGSTNNSGTSIVFEPDGEIFQELDLKWKRIVDHFRQQAYLVKGLRISVLDARNYEGKVDDIQKGLFVEGAGLELPSTTFYFEGGLYSLIKFYNQHQKPLHKNVFYVERQLEDQDITIEIALQYVDDISSHVVAFANNTYNAEGGMHVTGFKTALTRTINTYARNNKLVKDDENNFTGDDVMEGLSAVISVKLPEAQFEGQTKSKLGNVEARSTVETTFAESFAEYLEEHPDDARAIVNKSLLALRSRKAAKAAKDSVLRKGALEGLTLPGKLADCQTKSAEDAELFIVEGDSAGGSSKMGRDRYSQAILPLKGKILNVERARIDKMLSSVEIKALIVALGTGVGENFDITKLRYNKIIIATDADVDGAHIRTLLLTLFYRYFPDIIENEHLYIAQPPLYKVKKGKQSFYVYSEEEKVRMVGEEAVFVEDTSQVKATAASESGGDDDDAQESSEESEGESSEQPSQKKGQKAFLQRYKGLGEMNPEELWDTTMDPKNRILGKVSIEDAREADKVFDTLMGTDVPSRKNFIQSNAKFANIDV